MSDLKDNAIIEKETTEITVHHLCSMNFEVYYKEMYMYMHHKHDNDPSTGGHYTMFGKHVTCSSQTKMYELSELTINPLSLYVPLCFPLFPYQPC